MTALTSARKRRWRTAAGLAILVAALVPLGLVALVVWGVAVDGAPVPPGRGADLTVNCTLLAYLGGAMVWRGSNLLRRPASRSSW